MRKEPARWYFSWFWKNSPAVMLSPIALPATDMTDKRIGETHRRIASYVQTMISYNFSTNGKEAPILTHMYPWNIETRRTWEIHVQCRVSSVGKRITKQKAQKAGWIAVGCYVKHCHCLSLTPTFWNHWSHLKFNPSKEINPCPKRHVGVSKSRGETPKMDGENHGSKPYGPMNKWMISGGVKTHPYFWFNTHVQ